ncbi:hypothetical protein AB0A95_33825 [Micromonospora sp. NPDC049230]|uniref:hypothetical protein n=1 Tax=Micromonospora sp. NPDC049230 TaxID=3155502 RepID=UPI0033C6C5BE
MQALDRRLDGNPHRPSSVWACADCEAPWPCQPARDRLAEAYRGEWVNLSIYMAVLLEAALPEMPATPSAELFERFVLWTRGPHPAR